MSKDISGSVWPVTSVLRPLKAQELLRDLESASVHCCHLENGRALPSWQLSRGS